MSGSDPTKRQTGKYGKIVIYTIPTQNTEGKVGTCSKSPTYIILLPYWSIISIVELLLLSFLKPIYPCINLFRRPP